MKREADRAQVSGTEAREPGAPRVQPVDVWGGVRKSFVPQVRVRCLDANLGTHAPGVRKTLGMTDGSRATAVHRDSITTGPSSRKA